MTMIAVRGTDLYVEEAGTGPVLLFIHGMCGDADVWRGQVARLAERFHCITYDRRGHSRSPMGEAPESVETHAEDAAALVRELDIEPVVIGSSGGARIAVELGRRHPYLLSGAVFAEPPIMTLDPEAGAALTTEIAAAVRPAVEAGDVSAAVDAFFWAICPGLWSRLDEPDRDRYRANGQMLIAELSGPTYELRPNDLAAVDLPALVISGEVSHPALRAIAATLAANLPDARHVELPGSGHVTYAERPEEFAGVVAEFAEEASSTSPSARR